MDNLSTTSESDALVVELHIGVLNALGGASDTKTSAPDAHEPLEPPLTKERGIFKKQKGLRI